jgi:DNA-binding NarL/FixJ family response regulator
MVVAVALLDEHVQPDRGTLRVLVVDDHVTFAQSLAMALDAKPEFECVGTASTGPLALDLVVRTTPDVVVMDLELGADSGLDITRKIRDAAPDAVIVVLSAHLDPSWVAKASQAGASAFASKSGQLQETLSILKDAKHGSMLVAPSLYEARPAAPRPAEPVPVLTSRETHVLTLLGDGAKVDEIARILNITVNTCRSYVKAIHVKLEVHSQLEAVVKAQRLGLIAAHEGR